MTDENKIASAKTLLGAELPAGWLWKVKTTRNDPKIPGDEHALTLPIHRRTIHLFEYHNCAISQCRRAERIHTERLVDYMGSEYALPKFCLDCLKYATTALKWGA